jgi:tRNA threonylcarbamoyladenosine biosynthesis protein TsaB
MSDRLILAIDTSFGPVGIALATIGRELIAAVEADNPAGTQAETLPPLTAEMFMSAGVSFGQLARIAVTVGPGAFTGVRVGLAFAKGIRLATGATLLGVTTLECLAAQAVRAMPGRNVGVAIDAKRGEVYAQAFDADLRPLSDRALLPVESAAAQLRAVLGGRYGLTGSGAPVLADVLGAGTEIVESARIDAKLLALRMVDADPSRYPPTPAYLRAPDARLPS